MMKGCIKMTKIRALQIKNAALFCTESKKDCANCPHFNTCFTDRERKQAETVLGESIQSIVNIN
jgi:hypothetical protein